MGFYLIAWKDLFSNNLGITYNMYYRITILWLSKFHRITFTVRTMRLPSRDFLCSTGLPSCDLIVFMSASLALLSTHSCGMGMNVYSVLYQPKSVSLVSSEIPWISALNFWKEAPYNGLVKWPDFFFLWIIFDLQVTHWYYILNKKVHNAYISCLIATW